MVLVIINLKASISRRIFLKGSKWVKIGAVVKAIFRALKLSFIVLVYLNSPDLRPFSIPFNKSVRLKVIKEY